MVHRPLGEGFRTYWERFGTLSILVLILACFSIASPQYFFSLNNFKQIGLQSTIYTMLAFGEFFAILLAGIDLSVGSVAAFCGAVTAKMLLLGLPIPLCILIGILVGILMGVFNGALINMLQLHPFVVTLGTNTIFRGVTLVLCNGKPIFGLPQSFKAISLYWHGFPIPFIVVLVLATILIWFAKHTVTARNLYALGGNKQAAWYSGINTRKFTMLAHVLSSTMAAMAGIIMTSRVGAAEPTAGDGYETFAIAACIIGGTSFFGGKGKPFGVLLGGILIGTIFNGLSILNVSSFYQKIALGSLIIFALALEKAVANISKK
jgi:D-allose transport system permease protein